MLREGESSGLVPDFGGWEQVESLRVGALGEVIGWGVIEAREAGGRLGLRRRENGMGWVCCCCRVSGKNIIINNKS